MLANYGALCEKCPNKEFFRSVFARIWTEYKDLPRKSPCSVQMRENTDQKTSVFGQFLSSANLTLKIAISFSLERKRESSIHSKTFQPRYTLKSYLVKTTSRYKYILLFSYSL